MEEINDYQIEALIESASPVFTGEARHRLRLLRMALKLDQSQLAVLLGVGTKTITNAENGAKAARNPIILKKLIEVFTARGAVYILTGKYAKAYSDMSASVHKDYWKHKHSFKGNRTAYKDRVRYSEKSKLELMRENETLRKLVKESAFNNGGNEGET